MAFIPLNPTDDDLFWTPFAFTVGDRKKYALSFLPCKGEESLVYGGKVNGLRVQELNTWSTWRLIPVTVPTVAPPQVVTDFTDLKNKDGQLDETSIFYPETPYRQLSSGKFDFYLDFEYLDLFENNFYIFYTNILENLHGKKMIMVPNLNPMNCFFGRFFIEGISDDGGGEPVKLSIAYNLEPYIYSTSLLSDYYRDGKEATYSSSTSKYDF